MSRKICVVIGSRANYGSIKSAMRAIKSHPDLELQVVAGASAVLDRYGMVSKLLEADGFQIDARVYMLVEGDTPATMAKSTGLGLMEFPTIFEILKPDAVITVGDRFETMATAVAAAYMNIPLAHTMGGEVSGTIDESVRHAVTKLAHIHFPASAVAGERIIRMGEDPATVHVVGCPRMDLAKEVLEQDARHPGEWMDWQDGVGVPLDLSGPYLVVAQYPVTSEFGDGERQISETLKALQALKLPTVMLWPNADAGGEDIAQGMRRFREGLPELEYIHFYKNLPVEVYLRLVAHASCIAGNTSSAIREAAFLGTPAVNIGNRQQGRDRGQNVIDAPHDETLIKEAVERQLDHGRYRPDPIYGDGKAGDRIAQILSTKTIITQKRLCY